MKKLSVGARLTILLNACHAGCFFKDAEKDEGDRGEILAITLTGERNSIRDDHFLTFDPRIERVTANTTSV